MSIRISIVIPVFNSENYLKKSVESIQAQTYKDIEIILVNDGSYDSSSIICNEFANKDRRIKVVHQKNAGPSVARKEGIKLATGAYICFIDADDYVEPGMLKFLVTQLEESEESVDIIEFGYRKVTISGEVLSTIKLSEKVIEGPFECAYNYASQRNKNNFLWNKIFKKDLFKNVEYPNLYFGEDACLLSQLYSFSNKVFTIDKAFYNYVMTPNSLVRTPISEKNFDNIKAGEFMHDFYRSKFPELSNFSALYICSYSAQLYYEVLKSSMENKEKKTKYLLNKFEKYYEISRGSKAKKMSSVKKIIFIELFKYFRLSI